MVDLLLEPGTDTGCLSSADEVILAVRREVAELRDEVERLRRENLELRQQVGYWKSRHADAVERIAKLQDEIERLRGENRKLQAKVFGRSTEKQSTRDRSNDLDDPSENRPQRQRGQQHNNPGPKRRDYSHLPVHEEETRQLPEDKRVCPDCGLPLAACGTKDSERVEVEVRAYRRRIRRQRYQRTCSCPGPRTVMAAPEPSLIPKGRLGTSLWVQILVDKFQGHQPIGRQLEQWQLVGLDLASGTVTDGLQRLEPLFTPVYEALLARNSQSPYKQADETRWFVFADYEGKSNHTWWLWVFLGTDTVVYRLDPRRSHDVPEGHYGEDAEGVLMVDRLSSYKAMAQVKQGTLKLAFCWAHQRRDFVQVGKGWEELKEWALGWLRRIRDIYRCNRLRLAVLDKPAEFASADAALRQNVETLRVQWETELADPQLREPCRRALESLQNHWEGLTRFVDDPRIPMDNNASERCARGPAVGRKNYYGSGSLWSGRLAAMLFSIFATLRLCQLNPRQWLQWYLDSCAQNGGKAPADVQPFLPWNLSSEKHAEMALANAADGPDSS
jgi:transposase